jgi:plastocyanin
MSRRALFATAAVFVAGLAFAVPPAAAGGGGCHAPLTEASGDAVEIKDACFTPTNLYVEPGDKVTWVNKDDFGHVVAGGGGRWGQFEEMGKGDRVAFRFDQPGVYPYTCYLHPGMNGTVIVGKVTTPSGKVSSLDEVAPSAVSDSATTPPPPPVKAQPKTEPVASTGDSASPLQAVGFIAVGLIFGAAGALTAQRLTARRSRMAVTAG